MAAWFKTDQRWRTRHRGALWSVLLGN